jgi:hypothetical protein
VGAKFITLLYPISGAFVKGLARVFENGVDFYPPLGLIRVHRVDPKMPKQRGLLESPLTPALSPLEQGGRGYGSGGILPAKSRFGAPNKGGWCIPLSKTTQEQPFFEHPQPLGEGVRKCGFCPPPAGSPHCVRGTQSVRFPLPAGGTQRTPHANHPIRHTPTAHITPIRTLHTPKHLLDPTSGLREGSGGDRARCPRRAGRGAARVGEPVRTAIGDKKRVGRLGAGRG